MLTAVNLNLAKRGIHSRIFSQFYCAALVSIQTFCIIMSHHYEKSSEVLKWLKTLQCDPVLFLLKPANLCPNSFTTNWQIAIIIAKQFLLVEELLSLNSSLSSNKPGHVPYRESKLTRLLQVRQQCRNFPPKNIAHMYNF